MLIVFILFLIFFPVKRYYSFFAFSTSCNITFYSISLYDFNSLKTEILDICRDFEEKYSVTKENSVISVLNRTKKIESDPILLELIEKAEKVSIITNGQFDITIQSVLELWGFDSGNYTLPEKSHIEFTLDKVDYTRIISDSSEIIIGKDQLINTGALSKGKIIDIVYDFLKERNTDDFIVEFGGDLRVFSNNGRIFKVGIRSPGKSEICEVAEVTSGQAVATSGDYERYFEKDGKRYHHIISAETGYPSYKAESVTVISDSCVNSDLLSTAFFLTGYDFIAENMDKFDFSKVYIKKAGYDEIKIISK